MRIYRIAQKNSVCAFLFDEKVFIAIITRSKPHLKDDRWIYNSAYEIQPLHKVACLVLN